MRITNNLLIHNMLWNMNNNLVSMNEKQTQLATGKRIHKPSDDPVGTTRVIKVKSDIVENQQYKDNVRDAQSWLDVSENSLMDTKDILQRVRELAVQGANDTYTEVEADKIAKEIDQLIKEVIVNANSTIAGRYLFSGFKTDTKLLNDDGTYNVDVLSEQISNYEAISYEVAVGEYLPVGVNFLDVYGMEKNYTTMLDAFIFGDARVAGSQYFETTGDAATHSKVEFPFDYKTDLSGGADLDIVLDSVTYRIDKSELDGTITQAEFVEFVKSAEQVLPLPPTPAPTLGSVADIYFVASDDPTNKDGELVIEANAFGPIAIDISAMPAFTYSTQPPTVTNGVAEVLPVNVLIDGNFDYSKYFDGGELSFLVDGVTYVVDTEEFNEDMTDVDFVKLIETAQNSEGKEFGDIVNVDFVSTGVNVGNLTIEGKTAFDATVSVVDSKTGYTVAPTLTDGVAAVEGVNAKIEGAVDNTKDVSGDTISFTVGGNTYVVPAGDMANFDGTLTAAELQTALENATSGGTALSTVATVTVDGASEPYRFTIEMNTAADETVSVSDTGGAFVKHPYTAGDVSSIDSVITGTGKITDAMLADPERGTGTQSFVVTYNGTTKRIDIDMSTVNTTAELKTAIDKELNAAFGDDGGTPPVNNVTFDIVNNGTHDVVQFTGSGNIDGSRSYLKVDVVVTSKPQLIKDLEEFSVALSNKDNDRINQFLGEIDVHMDNVVKTLADIGAKTNRLDFIENRIDDNNIAMTEILTKVQDIDYAEVTIQFKSLESIYRASLSVGAKVIQPTLVDFIQ